MKETRIQKTWLVLLLLLLVMLVWGFARPALLPEGSLSAMRHYLLLIAQELILFGVPALLLRPWWSHGVHRSPRWRQGCLTGALAGCALALVMNPISAGWSSLMHMTPQVMPLPVTLWEQIAMILAVVVAPALAEEAFFRGGVLCGLARGVGGKAAFALTVAVFTLMHGRVAALPAHLACGALFTLGMLRYGKLWPSVVMHLAYNGGMLALNWLGVTLPWFTLILTLPAIIAIVVRMLRKTVWCDHMPIGLVDAALGVVAMALLAFYFVVQLR